MHILCDGMETEICASDVVIYWKGLADSVGKGLISIYRQRAEGGQCLRFSFFGNQYGDDKVIIDETFSSYNDFLTALNETCIVKINNLSAKELNSSNDNVWKAELVKNKR